MALPPGATMAVTGTYANTPRGTCKARICSLLWGTGNLCCYFGFHLIGRPLGLFDLPEFGA